MTSSSSRTLFTSDLHLFHKNIKQFCPKTRLGETPSEQVEILIEKWNEQVSPQDTVYVLGDVSFEYGSYEKTVEAVKKLNGTKHLIIGNHDHSNVCTIFRKEKLFQTIDYYKKVKKLLDKNLILCHYPIYEWDKCHYGTYHLYGHVHGRTMEALEPYRAMDVGLDAVLNYGKELYHIWTVEEIEQTLEDKLWKGHHPR